MQQNWELRTFCGIRRMTAVEFFKDAMAHMYQRSLTPGECQLARNQAEFYEKTGMPENYAVTYYEHLVSRKGRWR
jgi:hypothetical protein